MTSNPVHGHRGLSRDAGPCGRPPFPGVGHAGRDRATAGISGGGGVLVDGGAEWHVVHRFASEGSALAWEKSPSREQWDARLEGVAREAERRRVPGARAWSDAQTLTPAPPAPPAKWKLWFVNMSAVFPPVLLFNPTVLPHLGDLNALFRTLLLCLCLTALVTWILMPRPQRSFRK